MYMLMCLFMVMCLVRFSTSTSKLINLPAYLYPRSSWKQELEEDYMRKIGML